MFAAFVVGVAFVGQPEPLPAAFAEPTTTAVIAGLVDSLADRDRDVRQAAALALANFGPDAVEPLRAALANPRPEVRAWAGYALGQMGPTAAPATAELLKQLKDADADARRHAAYALGRVAPRNLDAGPANIPPPPVFPGGPLKP